MSADMRALVAAAQTGDHDAYTQLYRHYERTVLGYLTRHAGDRHLAEDLTQEVFLRAWRRINTFTWQGHDLGAWLTTIARNLLADHRKRGSTQHELAVADVTPLSRSAAPSTETLVLAAQEAAQVREALAALAPHHRQALVLQLWGGLSSPQIAAQLGCTAGAVKMLQFRGRQTIGARLRLQSTREQVAA